MEIKIMKYLLKISFGLSLFLLFFTLSISAQKNEDFYSAPSNLQGSEYPKISGDFRVYVRLKAPQANKVQVVGGDGFCVKPFDLARDTDGNWNGIISSVTPGFHYYWFIVDGVQVNDPASESYFGYGRPTGGIIMPTPGEDFYLIKNVPHGEVREHWYFSDITGKWRRSFVYTPPDYEANPSKRYPVLFLLHGGGENESSWTHQGQMNFILDNLIADGKATPMIVVMDNNSATPKNKPVVSSAGLTSGAPDLPKGAGTVAQIYIKEIIPSIDSFYRTIPDRENRAIAGLSMGGLYTFFTGLGHIDLFSSFGLFSAALRENEMADPKIALNGVFSDASSFNRRVKVLWIGSGTEEPEFYNRNNDISDKLSALNIKFTLYESKGTYHEWLTWQRCLNEFAPLLFK
jgi:enterochelin esterase-like enzyme